MGDVQRLVRETITAATTTTKTTATTAATDLAYLGNFSQSQTQKPSRSGASSPY